MKRYDLILIRGAPGVGKSTLSENLKKHFPDGVSIETDAVRNMINHVEWIPSTTLNGSTHCAALQNIHGLEAAWAAGRSYLANGYSPVLLVDNFTIPQYNRIVSLIHESRPALSYHTIALYCTDRELVSRLNRRHLVSRFIPGKKVFSDKELSLRLNEEVRNHWHRNETALDTTGLSAESVTDEALRILQ